MEKIVIHEYQSLKTQKKLTLFESSSGLGEAFSNLDRLDKELWLYEVQWVQVQRSHRLSTLGDSELKHKKQLKETFLVQCLNNS